MCSSLHFVVLDNGDLVPATVAVPVQPLPAADESVGEVAPLPGNRFDELDPGSDDDASSDWELVPARTCFMMGQAPSAHTSNSFDEEAEDEVALGERPPAQPVANGPLPAQRASPPRAPPRVEDIDNRRTVVAQAHEELLQEHDLLERDLARRNGGNGTPARERAWDVQNRIVRDDGGTPHFPRAAQNIATAITMMRNLPPPSTPEERKVRDDIRRLMALAAEQQAQSSIPKRQSAHTSTGRVPIPAASVHSPAASSAARPSRLRGRLGDNRDV